MELIIRQHFHNLVLLLIKRLLRHELGEIVLVSWKTAKVDEQIELRSIAG